LDVSAIVEDGLINFILFENVNVFPLDK
jgi:hypothetical protein